MKKIDELKSQLETLKDVYKRQIEKSFVEKDIALWR